MQDNFEKVIGRLQTLEGLVERMQTQDGPGSITPSARVYNDANISISHNTITTIALNSERWDTDAIHDNTTNNSRLTCKTAGIYSMWATIQFASSAVGNRAITIRLNGTTVIGGDQRLPADGISTTCNVSVTYNLAVNDYIEVQVFQTSGDGLNVESNANRSPEFGMTYLGKAS